MASKLVQYMKGHGIGDASVAELLECDRDGLSRLALCRAPALEKFVADVRRIAEFVPCNADALAQLLREVDP